MIAAAAVGFATGFSLILAIGAQNAFVLRQGLIGAHVFPLCLFCAVSDALLIAAGVAGFAALVARLPWLPDAMALGGAAFLLAYAAMRLRAAWIGDYGVVLAGGGTRLWTTLATAAAFTWANPHVYLDTLGLIGAASAPFTGANRTAYAAGAMTASFVFFFLLGYGARWLAPWFRSPRAWSRLDVGIAVLMSALALGLLHSVAV